MATGSGAVYYGNRLTCKLPEKVKGPFRSPVSAASSAIRYLPLLVAWMVPLLPVFVNRSDCEFSLLFSSNGKARN
jgi:hypothetical protein